MSITPSHHEVHQRMREQVRKMGLPVQITRKLRDGAEVMAIMPDEYTIKRKHWTMGSVTFKCIMDCLRALKKELGVQQDTVWAMLTDLLIEFTNAKLEEAGKPVLQFDHKALFQEWLDTQTSPQYERKSGTPKRGETAPARHHVDFWGRPLALMPSKAEKEAAKAAAESTETTEFTTQGEEA